jgi:hypothetical protein
MTCMITAFYEVSASTTCMITGFYEVSASTTCMITAEVSPGLAGQRTSVSPSR